VIRPLIKRNPELDS